MAENDVLDPKRRVGTVNWCNAKASFDHLVGGPDQRFDISKPGQDGAA
jgi:hypothetical protein